MEAFKHYGSLQGTCNISNGVDLDLWGVDVPPECRTNLSIWTGGNGKGYEEFLIPLSKACKESQFDLRFIGKDGWNSDRSVNTDVVWPQPRMRDWYNSAKIVLCSSSTEATPNYLLEAMACGCVPVSTKVGNLMEFGVDGENCCLARGEIVSFVTAIEFVLGNYDRMHAASVESIQEWGWKSRSALFYEVFRSLLAGKSPDPFTYMDAEKRFVAIKEGSCYDSGSGPLNKKKEDKMSDVLINCSLSNATAVVFVHADDYRIYQESDGERNCVGLWHPDGQAATNQWKRDHPMLAKHLLREAGAFSPKEKEEFLGGTAVDFGKNSELIEAFKKQEVFYKTEGKELVIEVSDAIVAEKEEEEPAEPKAPVITIGDVEIVPVADEDLRFGTDELVAEEEAKSDEDYEALVSLGLPDSCLDELSGAGLFTKEAIIAFEDLSTIKGIGAKTRDKILNILKGE